MRRALLLLGPTEALLSMGAFLTILTMGGWTYGDEASAGLLSVASGSAFAVIAVAQIANAFACRSAQVAVVELPALQTAFGTAHLDLNQWLVCAAMASSVLVFDEVRKLISRTRARH